MKRHVSIIVLSYVFIGLLFSMVFLLTVTPVKSQSEQWVTVVEREFPDGTTSTVYGLVPAIKSRYIVEVGWDSSGSLRMGGIELGLYSTSVRGYHKDSAGNTITDFTWNVGTNRPTIIIDSEPNAGSATVTVGSNTNSLPMVKPAFYSDRSSNIFTPYTMGASSSIKIYKLTQQIYAPSLVTAIGSTKYQAFGYDGPHGPSSCQAGMEEIRAQNMTATIFADITYIYDYAGYLTYLNDLVDDEWEVGIHFTGWNNTAVPPTHILNIMSFADAQAEMISQYDEITQAFNNRPPESFCLLGVGRFSDQSRNQWVVDNLDMFVRGWRVPEQMLSGSHDIMDSNINYFMGAANQGVATIPIYAHETEIATADSGDISAHLFDQWLTAIFANGVKLTGYQNWYMVNSNQLDATFQTSTSGTDTTITANTNGYNAIILVKILADTVTSVKHDGKIIDYSRSPEGYIIFEVENGKNYIVSTGTTPPSMSTMNFTGKLIDHYGNPVHSEITIYEKDTTKSVESNLTDQSGNYNLQPPEGIYDIIYRLTDTGFFIPNFFIKIMSLNVSSDMIDVVKRITGYPTYKKVALTLDIDEEKVIRTYSPTKPRRVLYNSTELKNVALLTDLTKNAWFYDSVSDIMYMKVDPHTTPTPIPQNQYTLTVNIVGKGSVAKSPDKQLYDAGETVTITASPRVNGAQPSGYNIGDYVLYNWCGDASGRKNPLTITMDRDIDITVNFAYAVNEQNGVYLYEDLDGLSPTNPYQTPYFVHGPNLGDYPVLRVVGTDTEKPIGGGITLSNVVVDDDWYGTQNSWDQIFGIRGYPAYFAAAIIDGNGNSMEYVTLRNCRRYGLDVWGARNFYMGYCKVEAGQHCICLDNGYNGIIEHNYITGIWIDGIKVATAHDTVIRNNYIDFSPYEVNPNYLTGGIVGCDFNSDNPNDNRNVTFYGNEYVRWLGDGRTTYAFTVEGSAQGVPPDVNGDLGTPGIPNLKFIKNRVTSMAGTTYPAYIYGNYIEVTGNNFINTQNIYQSSDAYGNIISPNTFLTGYYTPPTPPVAGAQITDCSSE